MDFKNILQNLQQVWVVADSNDPPTGRGIARSAKIKGGGGRAGQADSISRGGRQAHPPKAQQSNL